MREVLIKFWYIIFWDLDYKKIKYEKFFTINNKYPIIFTKTKKKQNCWEYWKCGRGPNGDNVDELEECPIPTNKEFDGIYKGRFYIDLDLNDDLKRYW